MSETQRNAKSEQHRELTHLSQLYGWEIMRLERYKPGIVRVHARLFGSTNAEFQLRYAKDEVFANVQLPPP